MIDSRFVRAIKRLRAQSKDAELSTAVCVARDERKAAVGNSGRAWVLTPATRSQHKAQGVPPAPCWSLLGCGLPPQTPWEARPPPAAVAAAPPSSLPISENLSVSDDRESEK
jgi:hypothetical protein